MLIRAYQESWIDDFNAIKRVINEALINLNVGIEHVGSTSVPHLAAKPIIDIDIVYGKDVEFAEVKMRLEKIGYDHRGNQGIPQREVFKRNEKIGTHKVLDGIDHHLYACPMDSEELRRHILFRDYLRANEGARIQYQKLKYEIAAEANQDRKRYAQLKEVKAKGFIDAIIDRAERDRTTACAHGQGSGDLLTGLSHTIENYLITIRQATLADTDRIWELWKAIVEQKIYFPYDESYTRAQIESAWINFHNAMYVAEIDGVVAGAYILKPNQPGYGSHIANAAYMVDEAFRGRSLGGQLCAHSIVAARALGYRGMQFNLVVSTNESAVRAWLANGFRIIGTVPGGFYHYQRGYVDAYIFFRDLTDADQS